jgi:hypothetical protein
MIGSARARVLACGTVAALAFSLTACVSGSNGAQRVQLSQLSFQQQAFSGKQVLVRGLVEEYRDPQGTQHAALTDDHGNRVELRPLAAAASWRGKEAQVHGVFRPDPPAAWFLQVLDIHRLSS